MAKDNAIPVPGNHNASPEHQWLGSVEAPIIRAALTEVDYSVNDTYAQVLHLPLHRAGVNAVAATVEHDSGSVREAGTNVAYLDDYRLENNPDIAAVARQAIKGIQEVA